MSAPPLRTASTARNEDLERRLDVLVPVLMERAALDVWIISGQEYNEDPVLQTMLPETWLGTARRRTMIMFLRYPGGAVERMAIARHPMADLFPPAWDPEIQPDQWSRVAEVVAEHHPRRIGVQTSENFPLCDGLSASEHRRLVEALGPGLADRLVSAEEAAIGWLETRTPHEIGSLSRSCEIAHDLLRTALSREVIEPGSTTTADVEWWLRQNVHDSGFRSWFHPACTVQRQGETPSPQVAARPPTVIDHGDLVHIDFGLVREGLHTDQQQHGYVLRRGEHEAPDGVVAGMLATNRLQDMLMAGFRTGITGNELLAETLATAAARDIDGSIYSHPIGLHGHGAGPTIGLWDRQGGVPGPGDRPVWPDTAYSIELQTRMPVAEWGGQTVRFMLEEDAWFDGASCSFLDGRQTEPWLI